MTSMGNLATGELKAMFRGRGWTFEHRFYLGYAIFMGAAVFLGFARTFFFRHWFPNWSASHAAPEHFFMIHGVVYAAWFALFIAQVSLVGSHRIRLHQQ